MGNPQHGLLVLAVFGDILLGLTLIFVAAIAALLLQRTKVW
jgi:hypothetical protein